jgi:hypothetical protein
VGERNRNELRSTAYHDAGHAVAAHALGRRFTEVKSWKGSLTTSGNEVKKSRMTYRTPTPSPLPVSAS